MDIDGMTGADDASGMNKFSSLTVSKFLAVASTAIPSAPEDYKGAVTERGESVDDADKSRRRKKDKKNKKNKKNEDQEPHDCPTDKSKKKRRREKDECSIAAS